MDRVYFNPEPHANGMQSHGGGNAFLANIANSYGKNEYLIPDYNPSFERVEEYIDNTNNDIQQWNDIIHANNCIHLKKVEHPTIYQDLEGAKNALHKYNRLVKQFNEYYSQFYQVKLQPLYHKLMKSHRDLMQTIIRIYGRHCWNNKNFQLPADRKFFLTNSLLAKELGSCYKTVINLRKRLEQFGLLTGYVFHGHKSGYEIAINTDLLVPIFQNLEKFDPVQEAIHKGITDADQLKQILKAQYTFSNFPNNLAKSSQKEIDPKRVKNLPHTDSSYQLETLHNTFTEGQSCGKDWSVTNGKPNERPDNRKPTQQSLGNRENFAETQKSYRPGSWGEDKKEKVPPKRKKPRESEFSDRWEYFTHNALYLLLTTLFNGKFGKKSEFEPQVLSKALDEIRQFFQQAETEQSLENHYWPRFNYIVFKKREQLIKDPEKYVTNPHDWMRKHYGFAYWEEVWRKDTQRQKKYERFELNLKKASKACQDYLNAESFEEKREVMKKSENTLSKCQDEGLALSIFRDFISGKFKDQYEALIQYRAKTN